MALFDPGFIVWLQSYATPVLTTIMQVVTLAGYSGVYITAAAALAFCYRLRPGAALILLLATSVLAVNAVKEIVRSPRPDVVDSRVRPLNPLRPEMFDDAAAARPNTGLERLIFSATGVLRTNVPLPPSDSDEVRELDSRFGFPSGHVASATVLCLGGVFLFGWRRAWIALAVWVPLMGLSRMYLGRHFPGDVLGGVGIGAIVAASGVWLLPLPRLAQGMRARRLTRPLLVVPVLLALVALAVRLPRPEDAGRLLGFALALTLLIHDPGGTTSSVPLSRRAARLVLGVMLFAAASWALAAVSEYAGWQGRTYEFASAALPAWALLAGPFAIERWASSVLPHGN